MPAPAAVMPSLPTAHDDVQRFRQTLAGSSNMMTDRRQQHLLRSAHQRLQEPTRDQRYTTNDLLVKPPPSLSFSQEHFDTFMRQEHLFVRKRDYPHDTSQRRRVLIRSAQSTEKTADRLLAILNWDGNLESTLSTPYMDRTLGSVKTLECFFPDTYPFERRNARLARLSKWVPSQSENLDTRDVCDKENEVDSSPPIPPDELFDFGAYYSDHEKPVGEGNEAFRRRTDSCSPLVSASVC